MKLVGFNFNKISIEKFSERPKDLKINTKMDISEIKNVKSDILKTKEEILTVSFSYVIDYEPSFVKINFEGKVIIAVESKKAKGIIKEWKSKKISEDLQNPLFNIILTKSNIKALQLEEEMNLPHHIPLPSLSPKKTEKQKK